MSPLPVKGSACIERETSESPYNEPLTREAVLDIAFRVVPLSTARDIALRNHALGKKQGLDHKRAIAKLRARIARGVSQ